MTNNILAQAKTCWQLLIRDLQLMKATLVSTLVDSAILVSFTYLMYGQLLPFMGSSTALITPTFFGILVLLMINITYDRAMLDAIDFESTNVIGYQLTLPISSWMLAIKYVLSYVIDLIVSAAPVFIMAYFLYGSLLQFDRGNWFLFTIVSLLSMIFVTTLLFTVALAKPLMWFSYRTWPYVLLPMTLLGSLYYPYKSVIPVAPWLSIFMRFLPTTAMVEGLRASLMGGPTFLPASICIVQLFIYCVIMSFFLVRALRKRFDPVWR